MVGGRRLWRKCLRWRSPGVSFLNRFKPFLFIFSSEIIPGKFNMKIGAVDRDSQRILATCDFELNVQGQANVKLFKDQLVTKFVERGKWFLSLCY